MLWGRNIFHWTESPQQALDVMIELNDKYALDGQEPACATRPGKHFPQQGGIPCNSW